MAAARILFRAANVFLLALCAGQPLSPRTDWARQLPHVRAAAEADLVRARRARCRG